MTARLVENLATTPEYAAIFSDEALVQAMLDFERALARAESLHGVIPPDAADAIERAATAEQIDVSRLRSSGFRAGTLALPLVKMLTEKVRAAVPESSGFVHWGATSQDVSDTATILLLRQARGLIASDSLRLRKALRRRSDEHAATVMLGRTLLQAAPPTTLGLKIAGWYAAAQRGWSRLEAALEDAMVLQFGGATGTLAALGNDQPGVARELAKQLDLALPEAPWHTNRDRLAAVICACGIYVGSLAKMAKDVSLLMQTEVGEASEPGGNGRGGSSTMPHKRNPIACALALAAGNRVPGYVASFLAGMPQEHERGVGGWHAETATIARTIEDTGLAITSMIEVAEGLAVDAARMESNIGETHETIFAERAMMKLGASLGRDAAHKLLEEAVQQSIREGRTLTEVLAAMTEVRKMITPAELRDLSDPKSYLGAAEEFRKQLLATGE